MIPDKIYLGIGPMENGHGRVIYSEWVEEPYPGAERNVEYIRKDALLEWAKEKQYESLTIVADNFWQEVIDKLNNF